MGLVTTPPTDRSPGTEATAQGSGPALQGLDGLDPEALVRSSTYCTLVHAVQALERQVSPGLAGVPLTSLQYLVLGQARSAPASTPAELSRRCGLSPQHLHGLLDTLEERGLCHRHGERGRGRTTGVVVTESGMEALVAGWPVVHEVGRKRLSPAQHRQLRSLVRQFQGEHQVDPEDVVVLVDDQGRDAGTAPRATVHDHNTPLHRAFSTHLRDPEGRVLLTRRALHKRTWPGVWTNSACGHLLPGESPQQAALRRVRDELGVAPTGLRMVLPDFAYRATDASGIVENEFCPVMVGQIDPQALAPDPDEICEHVWIGWDELRRTAASSPFLLSPWSVLQVQAMGEDPWA